MFLQRLFRKRPVRIDDDPRVHVTPDISRDDFVLVNDQTYEYRSKVLPEALTIDFWEPSGLTRRILDSGALRSEVLDVGCGSGEIAVILAKHGFRVTGIDISPVAIRLAHEHKDQHPEIKDRLAFVVHDIETGPLPRKHSSALFSHTLEHVLNPDTTMKNIIASLKPGSTVYVSVPLKKAWNDRTHLRHFSPRSLKRFLASYSPDVEVSVDKKEKMIFATVRV